MSTIGGLIVSWYTDGRAALGRHSVVPGDRLAFGNTLSISIDPRLDTLDKQDNMIADATKIILLRNVDRNRTNEDALVAISRQSVVPTRTTTCRSKVDETVFAPKP